MGRSSRVAVPPPRGLVAERLVCEGEELVVFTWSQRSPDLESLTPSEREVLAHLVRGESNAEIARARSTSVRTIANQVARILRKTGCASRFDAIGRYSRVVSDD